MRCPSGRPERGFSTRTPVSPIIVDAMRQSRSLLSLLLLLLAACGTATRPGEPPEHVVLVTVGGLRADHTSSFLYWRETTGLPYTESELSTGRALAIDDLAGAGVLFAQAFAPCPDPLLAIHAVLEGRRAGSGATEESSLAGALQEQGVATAGFASWPITRSWSEDLGEGFGELERFESDAEAAARAASWVESRADGATARRFLWVHLDGPTFPFEPGVAASNLGERDHRTLFAEPGYEGHALGTTEFRDAVLAGEVLLKVEDRQHLVSLYDGEVAEVNARISWLLDRIRSADTTAWDRTLVVLAGTHGVDLFEHEGDMTYGPTEALDDAALHVPLLIRHPASLTGRRILREVVETCDVPDTILEWMDVPGGPRPRSLLALTDTYVERSFAGRPALAVVHSSDGLLGSARSAAWRLSMTSAGTPRLAPVEGLRQQLEDRAAERPEVVTGLSRYLDALLGGEEPEDPGPVR